MDREKVIGKIEEEIRLGKYWDEFRRTVDLQLLRDALELLKEPGTVTVKEDKINKCECGETVCRYWHPKFCGFCGRELLWY